MNAGKRLLFGLLLLAASVSGSGALAAEADVDHEAAAREYFTDTLLIDHNGEEVRFFSDVLKEEVVVINFIFTNCGGACPMMTEKLRMAREALGEEIGNSIKFISISIDPARDTPAAMRKFKETHRATGNWVFLTGTQENIDAVVKRLGQWSPEVEDHSTMMLAGNVSKRHWMKIMPGVPPPAIAEKLRMLLADT